MTTIRTLPTLAGRFTALIFALGPYVAAAATPDPEYVPWLGKELTIDSSSFSDHLPVGGKLTLVYDSEDNVVRVCTRSVAAQKATWRMDLAIPCNVALTFTRGARYCSFEDVKTGDAEILASCHRLRSHDVAMHPAAVKGAVELHDLILFLLQPTEKAHAVAVLLDSPSRVTHAGVAHID
jgi:hypothetical protein